jgi:hypothetical protein
LNHYKWTDKQHDQCYRDVVVSSPGFKEPPWEELDPHEHLALLEKLMAGNTYFAKPWTSERERAGLYFAQHFIDLGGRMLLWRARVFDVYQQGYGKAPPGAQAIVQLRTSIPVDIKAKKSCPGKPVLDWHSAVYFVTPDLSGPDPHVDPGTASTMRDSTLMLYQNQPYFVSRLGAFNRYPVWRNEPETGLMPLCQFSFVKGK